VRKRKRREKKRGREERGREESTIEAIFTLVKNKRCTRFFRNLFYP
jgi:hypothetical protein